MSEYQPIHAPRGTQLSCKGWHQEAALRMLMNNLDEEVGENPRELIVYGGTGKAARNWSCYHAIVKSLRELDNDETLLIQSGKPVGVFRTHPYAPRVLIANSNLVGHWATWEEFRRLEALDLIMYGQMTAGSWIYIGSQGIVQGTYETFAAAGEKHWGTNLLGKLVVSGGMGGMGGAQPLAATMNGAAFLGIDVNPERIERRVRSRYCDRQTDSLSEALDWLTQARKDMRPLSVGLVGNCAEVLPELVKQRIVPDLLTDQTSAHDPLNGYIPAGLSIEEARRLRARQSGRIFETIDALHRHPRAGDAGPAEDGCRHIRLWQQHPSLRVGGRHQECLRFSRIHPRLYPPALLPGTRTIPLGGALGRSGRYRRNRRRRSRSCFRKTRSCADGSAWPATGLRSRDCPRASAGWDRGSGHNSAKG